uniref:Uncharacterized protein n=1 Tax=Oryza glumipatula TaxID=40148 RepID=A0A0E0BR14_9ORYZ
MEEEAIAAAGEGGRRNEESRMGWSWWPTGAAPPSDSPTICISTSRSELLPLLVEVEVEVATPAALLADVTVAARKRT